eukprot:7228012-Prymnesium_polylepis.1
MGTCWMDRVGCLWSRVVRALVEAHGLTLSTVRYNVVIPIKMTVFCVLRVRHEYAKRRRAHAAAPGATRWDGWQF